MINIINLTPHEITIVREEGNIAIPASGVIARCSTSTERIGEVNGIPVTRTVFGAVEDLPDEQPDTVYIVSSLVAQAESGRDDLYIPNESIRDDRGRIIGCRSLGRIG